MQRIERYGVIALVFLLVTILAVSLWGENKEFAPGGETDELVAEAAPRPDAPISGTSDVTRRGARDRALPTSDYSPSFDAASRAGSPSANPASNGPTSSASGREDSETPAGRRRRSRNALPTPQTSPVSPSSSSRPSNQVPTSAQAAQAATEYVPRPGTGSQASRPAEPPKQARPTGAQRAASLATMRTCIVGGGETLSQIAQRELGTYRRWPEIAALNGNLDPNKVQKGMVLRLPERDSQQAADVVAQAMPAPKPASQPKQSNQAARSYRVQKGDVLSVIAQRELGSAKRWKEIVALNPKVDPDRLIVGAKLVLPGAGSVAVTEPAKAPRNDPAPRVAESARVAKADTSRAGGWSGGNGNGSKVR